MLGEEALVALKAGPSACRGGGGGVALSNTQDLNISNTGCLVPSDKTQLCAIKLGVHVRHLCGALENGQMGWGGVGEGWKVLS